MFGSALRAVEGVFKIALCRGVTNLRGCRGIINFRILRRENGLNSELGRNGDGLGSKKTRILYKAAGEKTSGERGGSRKES